MGDAPVNQSRNRPHGQLCTWTAAQRRQPPAEQSPAETRLIASRFLPCPRNLHLPTGVREWRPWAEKVRTRAPHAHACSAAARRGQRGSRARGLRARGRVPTGQADGRRMQRCSQARAAREPSACAGAERADGRWAQATRRRQEPSACAQGGCAQGGCREGWPMGASSKAQAARGLADGR